MGSNQAISVRANTYDDVFIDWKAKQGKHEIKVSVINLNPSDENIENNSVVKKDILVDLDTDNDGIGNEKDTDDDNDGLTDEEEITIGTDPQKTDTDNDGVSDKIDAFPKDKTESRDTDSDGLGDNKDLDDDGDGIFDQDELFEYGTNSLNTDSDSDGLPDKQEIEAGTNPTKADTDSDGANDSQDKYPLDSTKWQASLDSVAGLFNGNKTYAYFAMGIPVLLIIYFLFFRRKKRKR
jgi:LPXTG-motif cell wall-anchored protein